MTMKSLAYAAAFGAAGALAPVLAWAQEAAPERYPFDYHMMGWPGGYGMFFGPLIMIGVLVAVVVIAVLLVRWLSGTAQPGSPQPSQGAAPLDILRQRYARGEIDKDEFEERRRVLGE